MIPEAAVEAALSALLAHYRYSPDEVAAGGAEIDDERKHGSALINTILEAAAPHMLAEWELAQVTTPEAAA